MQWTNTDDRDAIEQLRKAIAELYPSAVMTSGYLRAVWAKLHGYGVQSVIAALERIRASNLDATRPSFDAVAKYLAEHSSPEASGANEFEILLRNIRIASKNSGIKYVDQMTDADVYAGYVEAMAYKTPRRKGDEMTPDQEECTERHRQTIRRNEAAYWREYLQERKAGIPDFLLA